MGRLTNNIDYCSMHCDFGKRGECFFKDKSKCYEKSMHDKLKAFEDIIDEPEKLLIVDKFLLEKCEEINKLTAELAEYKKLEEEGLLFQLPCKAGSTVYHVVMNRILEVENVDLFFLLLSVADNRFGKTVFLTQEEAEQALERMKEVQDVN